MGTWRLANWVLVRIASFPTTRHCGEEPAEGSMLPAGRRERCGTCQAFDRISQVSRKQLALTG